MATSHDTATETHVLMHAATCQQERKTSFTCSGLGLKTMGRKALHLGALNTDGPKACNISNQRNALARDGMQQGVRRHASLHPSDKGLATNEASATGRTVVRKNLQVDNTMVVTSRVLSTKQPACTAKSSVLPVPLQTATRTPSTQITIVLVTAKPQHFSFLPHTHQARKSTELPVGLATFTPLHAATQPCAMAEDPASMHRHAAVYPPRTASTQRGDRLSARKTANAAQVHQASSSSALNGCVTCT